jgi:hypothetical protein
MKGANTSSAYLQGWRISKIGVQMNKRRPLTWFCAWTLAIYLLSLVSFAFFVPPQGLLLSAHWHGLFFIPAFLTAAVGSAMLWPQGNSGVVGAMRGGVTGFVASILVCCVGCVVYPMISPMTDEGQAWLGMPLMFVVFSRLLPGR